jgi:hypothetical protein
VPCRHTDSAVGDGSTTRDVRGRRVETSTYEVRDSTGGARPGRPVSARRSDLIGGSATPTFPTVRA